jgi:hypothetical protein
MLIRRKKLHAVLVALSKIPMARPNIGVVITSFLAAALRPKK